jgi:hypothetical protein
VLTRNKHQLHRPIANLSCFQKSGIKIFNSLPSSLTSLVNKKSQFKVALKRYLNTHSCYSVNEFLMFENDTWCIYKSFLVFIYYNFICVDLQVTIQYFILTFYVKFFKIVLNCTYIHVLHFYDLFHILLSSDSFMDPRNVINMYVQIYWSDNSVLKALKFGTCWITTHDIASMVLQVASVQCVKLQVKSLEWLMDLVFLLRWLESDDPLHSFETNSEPKSDKIFNGTFCYHRIT